MANAREDGHARRGSARWLAPLTVSLVALLAASVRPAAAAGGCSLPVNSGTPKTSDCLFILQSAVEIRECALCICDVNGNGSVAASDALICLKDAVGIEQDLNCPPCGGTTTTTLPEI